jgi:hypothetical protein
MKNIVIWPRNVDVKIARVVGIGVALLLAGIVGLNLPSPLDEGNRLGICGFLVTVPAAVLVWAVFELIKPAYFTRNWRRWQIAELWIVPLVWAFLLVAWGIWLHHQAILTKEQLDSVIQPVIL